ncbi:hypothetical protein [Collinsella sp. An2]|uniref:hypothetical protein n=1 Tax=Collinsella sp. An2 TaxID=1965585 RepID=UPI000B384603|nr:hypothetical protein [Collinsella sp. An2]OUP06139.1 hypothetical protein B5F33_10475 [Collinsella sp. An2]
MNVKLVFADRIESWDTRADGSATTSHAALEVHGNQLVLWSALDFDEGYSESGEPEKRRRERGTPRAVLALDGETPETIPGFLEVAGERYGLLRFDVDGETLWQREEPYGDDGEVLDDDG